MKALSESCRKLRDFFCPEEMEPGLSWEREGQIGHEVNVQYIVAKSVFASGNLFFEEEFS